MKQTGKLLTLCLLLLALALGLVIGLGAQSGQERADGAGQEDRTQTDREGEGTAMPAFSTKDLDGNIVNNSIFEGKKLTVVNVWGTFCSPCIREMPELAAWAKEMPEDVQLIGLVIDIAGEEDLERIALAKEIVEKAEISFTNLTASDDLNGILRNIVGVPTTFFVNGDGYIVGESIVGANVPAYKNFVEDYLNENAT